MEWQQAAFGCGIHARHGEQSRSFLADFCTCERSGNDRAGNILLEKGSCDSRVVRQIAGLCQLHLDHTQQQPHTDNTEGETRQKESIASDLPVLIKAHGETSFHW